MEIIVNTSIITLVILATASVWGMVGAVIVVLIGADKTFSETVSYSYRWPVVLVLRGAEELVERRKKQ